MNMHPITRKRLKRFREFSRAYWSFWLFVAAYGLSLFSEVVCNSRPLYLRYDGHSYFPVFFTYSQSEILRDGVNTRPNYKQIRDSEDFKRNPANCIIFPVIPYGPLEILEASSIKIPDRVVVTLAPDPRVATVDVRPDLSVARSGDDGFFLAAGQAVTNDWSLPESFASAIHRRFVNQDAAAASAQLASRTGRKATVSLSEFAPRAQPPKTVRLTFREDLSAGAALLNMEFARQQQPTNWYGLGAGIQSQLMAAVEQRFVAEVPPLSLQVKGALFRASFEREVVRFPMKPVPGHPFGIDSAGRDVAARILYAWRTSISFGLTLVLVSMFVGTLFGAFQGYYGGARDIVGQRLVEIWDALPFLYIMMLIGSVFGRGFLLLLICYGLFNWIGISYYMRAEFLRLRSMPFVESAKCLGLPARKIIFRHILPNALVPIITFFPFSLVGAISVLAALDYLGFGLPPPTPSWGELLLEAQDFSWAWWLVLYPSLTLFAVILLCVFIGEGVRSAFDPRKFSKVE